MLELSDVRDVVHDEIRALLSESGADVTHLSDDDQLHDLGFNSLLLARLIIQLEAELGVDPFTEDVTISDARSVGALVAVYVRALTGAGPENEALEQYNVA